MINIYPKVSHEAHLGEIKFTEEIDNACNDIFSACKGFGTDEEVLTSVLGSKNATQRYLIARRYPQLHSKSLKDVIQSETSGKYGHLLSLLAVPIEDAEATMVFNATKGQFGTSEKHVGSILCGRSNGDIEILKKAYFKLYDEDLNVRVNSELSGDLKDFAMICMQELTEEFDESYHTSEKAESDAKEFYKAGEGKFFGTDEKALYKLISTSPPKHLIEIDRFYTSAYDKTLETAIKNELGGKLEDEVLFAVGMTLDPYQTIAELFESTMKGFGTDEVGLIHNLVRYQHVFPKVNEAYEKKYGKSLQTRIKGEIGGKFEDLAIQMLESNA